MSKTIMLLIGATLLLILPAIAELKEFNTSVRVEWLTNNEFEVITDGDDKRFICGENHTSDKTWNVVYYRNINIDDCKDREYNASTQFARLTDTCNTLIGQLNSTYDFAQKFASRSEEYGRCVELLFEKRNQTTTCQSELNTVKERMISKENAATTCETERNAILISKKEAEDKADETKNMTLIVGVAALVVGGFIGSKFLPQKGKREESFDEDM